MLAVLVICSAESCYELDESHRQKKMPDDRLTKSEGSLLLNLFSFGFVSRLFVIKSNILLN